MLQVPLQVYSGTLVSYPHTDWRGLPWTKTVRDAVAGGFMSHRATAMTISPQTDKVPESFLFSYKQWEISCMQTAIC